MANRSIYLPDGGCNDSETRHLVPDAAVRGNVLFTGGIAGFADDGTLPETNADQAQLAYDRLERILDDAGFTTQDVAHCFVWAPDRHSQMGAVNPHWRRLFPDKRSRPARHAIARRLDPGVHYRLEAVAVKNASRRSHEIGDRIFHTGMEEPGFIPFGTTAGDLLYTGATYGMYPETRKMGESARAQAELAAHANDALFAITGYAPDNIAHLFIWYHDEPSRAEAIAYTETLFPDRNDRPAIHYIQANLPFWAEDVQGQFYVQYDVLAVRNARRRIVTPPGVLAGDSAPAGVAIGDRCFTSMILGSGADFRAHVATAFGDALTTVEAAGFAREDVGHAYVWYADHAARTAVDEVWMRYFPQAEQRPARHCIVADLPANSLAGVELTAAR